MVGYLLVCRNFTLVLDPNRTLTTAMSVHRALSDSRFAYSNRGGFRIKSPLKLARSLARSSAGSAASVACSAESFLFSSDAAAAISLPRPAASPSFPLALHYSNAFTPISMDFILLFLPLSPLFPPIFRSPSRPQFQTKFLVLNRVPILAFSFIFTAR